MPKKNFFVTINKLFLIVTLFGGYVLRNICNLREKLLKIIVVIHGCTSLLCFGELPQQMMDYMRYALTYLEIPDSTIKQIKIQEMSQEDMKKGCAGYTRFEGGNCPIVISLDKNMFSSQEDSVKKLLINHTLLREAVRVSYFLQVPLSIYEQHYNDERFYWHEDSGYQICLALEKKLWKSLQKFFAFFLVSAASFWLVNKVGTKISSLGKVLGGLVFVSVANLLKNSFRFYKNGKKLSVYRDTRSDDKETLKRIAYCCRDNIIDVLNYYIAYFDIYCYQKTYSNTDCHYNRGKCIQMRDDFLVDEGTLAVMFYNDRESYDKYIKHPKYAVEVEQS